MEIRVGDKVKEKGGFPKIYTVVGFKEGNEVELTDADGNLEVMLLDALFLLNKQVLHVVYEPEKNLQK